MYQVQFVASSSADWAAAVELIDASTNQPLDVPVDATFNLTIGGRCWSDFKANTADGKITRPADNIVQWRFSHDDIHRFWPRNTYDVGLTMTTTEGTIQLLIGTLSIIDGIV